MTYTYAGDIVCLLTGSWKVVDGFPHFSQTTGIVTPFKALTTGKKVLTPQSNNGPHKAGMPLSFYLSNPFGEGVLVGLSDVNC